MNTSFVEPKNINYGVTFPYLFNSISLYSLYNTSIEEKENKFLNNLKWGDRFITKSGVHARITEFDSKSNTCIVETMAGKLKIEKSAISLELSSNLNT